MRPVACTGGAAERLGSSEPAIGRLDVLRDLRSRRVARVVAVALVVSGAALVTSGSARAAVGGPGGEYQPIVPARVLDTRSGLGSPVAKVPGGGSIDVTVAGVAGTGVPADGVLAVALNVTATNPTLATYVTVWPTGAGRPLASTVNVGAGRSAANLAVVGVGAGGKVSIFVAFGSADIVLDVVGWFASATAAVPAGTGSRLLPVTPERILDTRTGNGATGAVGATQAIDLQVTGRFHDRNGAVVGDATAVVLNLTGVEATADTFVTAYPAGVARPPTSSLNLVRGETRPNLVMVKLGAGGKVSLYNHQGATNLVADVVGFFRAGVDPSTFAGRVLPLAAPFRAFDTRNDGRRTGTNQVDTWDFSPFVASATAGGVPVGNVSGLVLNVTATDVTEPSYLTAYPTDVAKPVASNLNMVAGDVIPNLAVIPLSGGAVPNRISTYYFHGFTHYLADVSAVILAD